MKRNSTIRSNPPPHPRSWTYAAGIAATAIAAAVSSIPISAQKASVDVSASSHVAYGKADLLFQDPYVDVAEWRDAPIRHHYVHGGFRGTDLRFSFYFPDKAQYQGRFFQHLSANTPQTDDTASRTTGENNRIAFAFESGGYLVESNMGGATGRRDPTIGGFRASAAAADYSREIAIKLFGGKRPYGYVYGGSGGAYRTIAAIENTKVWDGAVPYVPGSTNPTGVVATGHERVGRMLKDKLPQILDAMDAGGSGNPYVGLNKDERQALREMLRFGVPLNIFRASQPDLAIGSSSGITTDPGYTADFWSKPGYEGADPVSYAARHRVQLRTTVAKLLKVEESRQRGLPAMAPQGGNFVNPVGADGARRPAPALPTVPLVGAIELAVVPGRNVDGAMLVVRSGVAKGMTIPIERSHGAVVAPGSSVAMDPRVAFFTGVAAATEANLRKLAMLQPGDEVELDNSASLAADVYNRYAVPPGDHLPWRQYRDRRGKFIHPQRDKPASGTGPGVGGTVPNGRFNPKVIMLGSLWDELAAPWNAAWYADRATEHWGPKFNDNYRLWYTDRAMHTDSETTKAPTQVVSFLGVIHQALRDLSAWVERGVPPPPSTRFRFVEGQIVLPRTAVARGGIQPIVNLRVNGRAHAVAPPGQVVKFSATIEVPPGTGKIIHAEWDFDGTGNFAVPAQIEAVSPWLFRTRNLHAFPKPGNYFVTLRAFSQRAGNANTPFGRVANLGRVRVIVE